MEWDVLLDSHGKDIQRMTHCVRDLPQLLCRCVLSTKTPRCYPNNKPWLTRQVKAYFNRKKAAFFLFKHRQRVIKSSTARVLKWCVKDNYRREAEQKLKENDMRDVWDRVKTITGYNTKIKGAERTMEKATELNDFFNLPMFSPTLPFTAAAALPLAYLPYPTPHPQHHSWPLLILQVNTYSPRQHYKTGLKTAEEAPPKHNSRSGCATMVPQLLKTCTIELGKPIQWIFNLSIQLGMMPILWRNLCIILVPQTEPAWLNDFRRVTLTSHDENVQAYLPHSPQAPNGKMLQFA